MTSKENLQELYERFLRNECTPAELSRLIAMFDAADEQELQQMVRRQLDDPSATLPFDDDHQYRYDRIFDQLKAQTAKSRPPRNLRPLLSAAAALMFILASAGYFWYQQLETRPPVVMNHPQPDIKPGGNRAYLTLSDGKQINLGDIHSGQVGSDGGKNIIQTLKGEISYVDGAESTIAAGLAMNALRTPNGGQYRVILPDGTKVWLNAASQLRYPANFKGLSQRRVDLIGEAYFEVSKDPQHPFILHTDDQRIRVLGTHFNVNAYHDDGGTISTLLEGSIHAQSGTSEVLLVPGQQVNTTSEGNLTVQPADTELAMAWKNDQFMFESKPLRMLMKSLARWYDVEIVYAKDVPDTRFNGAISKFENISEVLKILESTEKVHFQLEGRRVLVSKR